MRGNLLSEQDQDWNISLKCFKNARAVYEELGKYGDLRNQALCHEYIEDLESSIRICQNKIGASDLQTSELMQTGEMEEPALRLFRAKLEAVMAEECSQQAASMKEFHWLGHRFPIHNANISASILKAEELEKEVNEPTSSDISTEKKLVMFDKIFAAYHEAMSCICKDLNTAGDSEDTRDDLSGLGRAIGAVLGKRTIERNQLLVAIAKSKHQSEPEELVRLYDLLLQNATDLSDLVSSRRDIKPEELTLTEECAFKSLVFRAERCFYLAKSYSLAGKRTEAYALFCRAGSLASCVLKKGQSQSFANEVMMKELKLLYDNSRSNCCIEHATGIVEDEKAPAHLSDKLSSMSLTGVDKKMEKYLMENLDSYESAVADSNIRTLACIQPFPPEHQAIPCNPIVLDLVYNSIHFPSLENRMKKDKKGFITWLWR